MKTIKLLGIVNVNEGARVIDTEALFENFRSYINEHDSNVSLILMDQHILFFETDDKWLVVAYKEGQSETLYGRLYYGEKKNFFVEIAKKIPIFKDIDMEKVYNYNLLNEKISQLPASVNIAKRIKI